MTDADRRNEAKLTAAIEAMRPLLDAAVRASHDLAGGHPNDEDACADRLEDLGLLVAVAASQCGPGAHVLTRIAVLLDAMSDEHADEQQIERAPH